MMIMTPEDLRRLLHRLDGRGYKAYQDLRGEYHFPGFSLRFMHIQKDPFASPSRIRITIPANKARFPESLYNNASRRRGLETFLALRLAGVLRRSSRRSGTGNSGVIEIDTLGQLIVEHTAISVRSSEVEARLSIGLPAAGRRILGREAQSLLLETLPGAVHEVLYYDKAVAETARRFSDASEDADVLRERLSQTGLVAFIADGAVLPRRSGVDQRPMTQGVVPFKSPETLRVRMELPNAGTVTGMGIPAGITLIAGGGFHGKSTLLSALQDGVYNHIPGDGRELAVSIPETVKIRAEDGRYVASVDISPFIRNLPFRRDTSRFSTENASGSTSQAANIMEALEAGARCLLIDEDTAATNFMIRDHRMQELVAKDLEPITPFIDKARQLYTEHGVSSVLVVGGSGDYFDIADRVIVMKAYIPEDSTEKAREIATRHAIQRRPEGGERFGSITRRVPDPDSLDPSKGRREESVKVRGHRTIQFGRDIIDMSAVEQLLNASQTRAVAAALLHALRNYIDGTRTIPDILKAVESDIKRKGLDILDARKPGDFAHFRRFELAAALNRLRSLRIL